MRQYLDLLERVLNDGQARNTRSMPTLAMFGRGMRFDLTQGFPLLTTKKLHWRSIVHELLWIISGSTNTKALNQAGVRIWDEWADSDGELGPIYGKQWRNWQSQHGSIDQLARLIDGLKREPFSRRHLLNAWNPADIPKMALPPCHLLVQCWVDEDLRGLRLQLYQRSADAFLGLPFNIASYALLTHMLAQVCGLQAREFVWYGGDIHLYNNQLAVAREQLQRRPHQLPSLHIDPDIQHIDDFCFEHFTLKNYNPHPHLAVEVVV